MSGMVQGTAGYTGDYWTAIGARGGAVRSGTMLLAGRLQA
jgi:hypothetical protein